MPGPDPRTLVLVSAILPLSMAAILVGVRALRRMPAGFGAWTASQLALAVGAGLIAGRGFLPEWASVAGGNVLLVTGFALVAEGFRRFYELRRWFPAWADAAVLAATAALSFALRSSVNWRIVAVSALFAFYLGRCALEPLASSEGRRSPAQRVLTVVQLGGAVLVLVRAARAAAAPPLSGLFTEGWTVLIPGLVLAIVNTTSMYVALLLGFERSEGQLRAALSEVKTLTGLLPICMHCKKIRNDQGYWDGLERYLGAHTDARFSHGICPDCYAELSAVKTTTPPP